MDCFLIEKKDLINHVKLLKTSKNTLLLTQKKNIHLSRIS